MSTRVFNSKYKNVDSVTIQSDLVEAVILPEYGGKFSSIKYKGKELLWQNSEKCFFKSKYDTSFLDGDVSGFDEMFPTINSCFYPNYPWKGVELPDHGEVWALPWKADISEKEVGLSVNGVRLPYKFEKKVWFVKPDVLQIDYRVTNNTTFPMKFIWAAHPLFNIDKYSVLILPCGVEEIINAYGGRKRLGAFGKRHKWPLTITEDGLEYDMRRLDPSNNTCDKYYVWGPVPRGECAVYNEKSGEYIKFVFPVDKVPYLGIWLNENGLVNQSNIALEPCTGSARQY